MSFIRILAGDFRPERIEFDGVGLALRSNSGMQEYVKFSEVANVVRLEREWRTTSSSDDLEPQTRPLALLQRFKGQLPFLTKRRAD